MLPKSYNLLGENWIKVCDKNDKIQKVSLTTLFNHAKDYRQLAGDMHTQDLVILRFLEAILITVYSRFDAQDQPYDWLNINPSTLKPIIENEEDTNEDYEDNQDVLLTTWSDLYQNKQFSQILFDYLEKYRNRFDLFDPKQPFGLVTLDQFNQYSEKKIKPDSTKSQVVLKMLDRTSTDSANVKSINPFSVRDVPYRNDLTFDELIRWLLTYQQFSGVSDKTKIKPKSNKSSMGWTYNIHPIFAKGKNLFETLMLNLSLTTQNHTSLIEKPTWEQNTNSYIEKYNNAKVTAPMPDNLAELYTLWSRILHIEEQYNRPVIFSAKMAKPDNTNYLIEQMSLIVPTKNGYTYPALSDNDITRSLWTHYRELFPSENSDLTPGIIRWIKYLLQNKIINNKKNINLISTGFVNDGNKSSRVPAFEIYQNININTNISFDTTWATRITNIVHQTNIAISIYQRLAQTTAIYHGIHKPSSNSDILKTYTNPDVRRLYSELNEPFNLWLNSIQTNDSKDEKEQEWYKTVRSIIYQHEKQLLAGTPAIQMSHPIILQAETGDHKTKFTKEPHNLFEIVNYYMTIIYKQLPIQTKEDVNSD